ncbi:MAG TPA: chorismate mutase [Candidatus Fimousia stercorigallinarum]|nr:chorismate mutase [Candidatus Fimousia stercorigallinarum]
MIILEEYRKQLDLCDAQIVSLLEQRLHIIEGIMEYKKKRGIQILQPERERQVRHLVKDKVGENEYRQEILDIYKYIVENSKKIQAKTLFRDNIYIIGFMGCGKTTISSYLSRILAMDVIEMDAHLTKKEGMSVNQIFEKYGEEYWRNLETNLIIGMKDYENKVISCGGGVPMREVNVKEMKKNGKVILLTASPETILERTKDDDSRPLLRGRKNIPGITELMEARRPKYEAAADIRVNTDGRPVHEIAEEIVYRLTHFDQES